MNDLPNERAAVVEKLKEYNFEAVYAENFSANGAGSWKLLSDEIQSSDLMLLILGSRYGWIPSTGPQAGSGLSVTELEFREAKAAGIPILPFVSRLAYSADPLTPDAVNRDRFRKEIADWDGGRFREEFELAKDLSEKVGRALISLLSDTYFRAGRSPAPTAVAPIRVGADTELAEFLLRRPTLFAGAGISLQAGLPSARLMMDAMQSAIQEVDMDYQPPASGTAFNVLATDLENARGRSAVEHLARELVSPGGLVEASEFHRLALAACDLILTTNYDNLFETVIDERPVLSSELVSSQNLPPRALVKLHGTIDDPATLVLSEADLFDFMLRRPRLTQSVVTALGSKPVLVIGSSLRDPGVLAMVERSNLTNGMYVAPLIVQSERRRLVKMGLRPVEAPWSAIVDAFREAAAAV